MTTDLSARVASLSPERRLLLERIRRERMTDAAPQGPEPADGAFSLVSAEDRGRLRPELEDAYPLASMQLGMLYHMNLTVDEELPAYHNIFLFDTTFPVDVRLLQTAVQLVVSRHPVLRTAFAVTGFSEPLQLVYRAAFLPVSHIDLSALPNAAQDRALGEFVRQEKRRLIDFSRAPLLRLHLHQLAADRFRLTMTEPHYIAEGWSTYQTLAEIHENYLALARGEQPRERPQLTALYRDFIRLEREAMASEEHRRFWAERLEGATVARPALWPADRRGGGSSRLHHRPFPAPLLAGARAAAHRLGVPLKSVLMAVHMKVLSMICGQDDLTVGLHVHGRPETLDGERVLGVFNNTVPFRLRTGPGSWRELIRAAFEAELELLPYRRYPLVALKRDRGGEDPAEVRIGYVHFHLLGEIDPVTGVRVPRDTDRTISHSPLVIFFWAYGDGPSLLTLWIERGVGQIAEAQVKALHGYYHEALRAIGEDLDQPHHARSLLSAPELHQQLHEWNDTRAGSVGERTVVELFASQVAREPDSTAVVCDEACLTYGELDRRSSALAQELRRSGVGGEDRVGLCLDRSPDLLIALLGVLKAGAAFVPLDPGHPRERLASIAADAGLGVLLTRGIRGADLAGPGVRVVDLDSSWPMLLGSDAPKVSQTNPEGLAYVIYTSGSTGRPKGVMVTHRGLVNYLDWCVRAYAVADGRGAPVHSSIAVDMTVTSLLAPLLAGCAVVLLPEGQRAAAVDALLALEGGLSLVKATPTLLDVLNQRLSPERARGWTRCLILGGEQLRGETLAFWRAHAPETRLFNEYGPTETVVGCCVHELPADAAASGPVPIGRPIANLQIHLAGSDLQLLPLAVVGEVYIGGAGVARGYLGRPSLTAERFVPDPFSGESGARLYRTGDLARRLQDGALEFLGRNDHQVKVRGFRIELGEIESALAELPSVQEVVVVVRQDDPAVPRLVAYVVPAAGERPSAGQLRDLLAVRLPDFMVPASFVVLDALPLAPSGKLDRAALPAPSAERPELAAVFVPPQSEVERELATIWREVLGLEQVGVNDSFFELGGDSLLLLRVHMKVQERYRQDLKIADLFRYPTIGALAAYLTGGADQAAAVEDGGRQAASRRASEERRAQIRGQRRAARQSVEDERD